jgi:acetate CoA/acetoacetate CoA-transferase alpha subunit
MAVGSPERLIDELVRQGKRKLAVIANDTAMPGSGIGKLFSAGLISKVIASHLGLNPETQQQMIASKSPSSLCRKARSPSAFALEILTPTGVGTLVEEGERRIELKGKDYLLALARSACCRRIRLSISSGRSSSRISRHQTLKA